jgi:hypothetical protein
VADLRSEISVEQGISQDKYYILPPGSTFQRIIAAPKLKDNDLALFVHKQLESFIPGRQDDFKIDFLASEKSSDGLNVLSSIIRKTSLQELRKQSNLKIIPAPLYLLQKSLCDDGLYLVESKRSLDYCYIKYGELRLIGTMIAPIREKSLKDIYAKIETIDTSFNGSSDSKIGKKRDLVYWQYGDSFQTSSEQIIKSTFFNDTFNRFSLVTVPKTAKNPEQTNSLYQVLVKKNWYLVKKTRSLTINPWLALVSSLFILGLSISLPPLLEVQAWQNYRTDLNSRIEQLELSTNLNTDTSSSNDIIDLRASLPVKFSSFLSIIRRSLSSGDYITQLDFRNGDFVVDIVGRFPFSKRDFLAEQNGFSNIQVSQITSLNDDIRERFSIRGSYNYSPEGVNPE